MILYALILTISSSYSSNGGRDVEILYGQPSKESCENAGELWKIDQEEKDKVKVSYMCFEYIVPNSYIK